jgi:hypothetical protein
MAVGMASNFNESRCLLFGSRSENLESKLNERWASFLISGDIITVVEATVPDDDEAPIEILSDATWKVQKGDRPQAYEVLYGRCVNFLREGNVERAVIKASATAKGGGLAMLHSAEVRGVIIAAAATAADVTIVQKSVVSRTYGNRNVDGYLVDDPFWKANTAGGVLRKMSREPAMYIIATRAKLK